MTMEYETPKTRQERLAEEIASSREWREKQRGFITVVPGTIRGGGQPSRKDRRRDPTWVRDMEAKKAQMAADFSAARKGKE